MTEFEKFYKRFAREHFADAEKVEFECEADEFFHSYYFHLISSKTHEDLEQCVDFFEDAREEFRTADPDAYVRAEVKFANDFHGHALENNFTTADQPFPSIDEVLHDTVTLKAYEVEKWREEAEAAA